MGIGVVACRTTDVHVTHCTLRLEAAAGGPERRRKAGGAFKATAGASRTQALRWHSICLLDCMRSNRSSGSPSKALSRLPSPEFWPAGKAR